MKKLPKKARDFLSALILRGHIEATEVNIHEMKAKPRMPNNESYMRGWHQVGQRMGRKR